MACKWYTYNKLLIIDLYQYYHPLSLWVILQKYPSAIQEHPEGTTYSIVIMINITWTYISIWTKQQWSSISTYNPAFEWFSTIVWFIYANCLMFNFVYKWNLDQMLSSWIVNGTIGKGSFTVRGGTHTLYTRYMYV